MVPNHTHQTQPVVRDRDPATKEAEVKSRRVRVRPQPDHVPVQEKQPRTRTKAGLRRREEATKPETPKRLFLRGTNLLPTGKKVQACLAGSKQSILVDLLHRPQGATMAELREALAGGRKPWQEVTVRAGFGWDLKLKGYGVRSEFDADGIERFHLVIPKGQRVPPHAESRAAREAREARAEARRNHRRQK